MIKLVSEGKFEIKGRGDVYVINPLPDNLTAGDIIDMMKNKEQITIDETIFEIKGVERFKDTDIKCGILVKAVEEYIAE